MPDSGTQQNALQMEDKLLKNRDVVLLDLATEPVEPKDYKPETDPARYHSQKTSRGPLHDGWIVSGLSCCLLVSVVHPPHGCGVEDGGSGYVLLQAGDHEVQGVWV